MPPGDLPRTGDLLFSQHDADDLAIGFQHAFTAQLAEILDCVIDRFRDDPIVRTHTDLAYGQDSGLDRGTRGGRHFHRAAGLRAIADDAGDVADHVLNTAADRFFVT